MPSAGAAAVSASAAVATAAADGAAAFLVGSGSKVENATDSLSKESEEATS